MDSVVKETTATFCYEHKDWEQIVGYDCIAKFGISWGTGYGGWV